MTTHQVGVAVNTNEILWENQEEPSEAYTTDPHYYQVVGSGVNVMKKFEAVRRLLISVGLEDARPIIYLSGPMHGSKPWPLDREASCDVANIYGKALWKLGYWVFSPQGNTRHMYGENLPSVTYLAFDLHLIRYYIKHMFMLPGWEHSDGAVEELKLAKSLGRPIYYNLTEAKDALGV